MATELPAALPLRFKSNTQEIAMNKKLMGANTLVGNDVFNKQGEDLGDIK